MGNPKAFLTISRKEAGYRPLNDRIHDFSEVEQTLNSRDRMEQASRCMDCGVAFCHWACPLGNRCPEWNDALYRGNWEAAWRLISATNPFPEFTGRVCPALCEKSCVLNLSHGAPTTNRENEAAIIERAWLEGYVMPRPPRERTGKKVAVIGSGPAGLSAAHYLNSMGHNVTVIEKDGVPGGLLRYGIPNFKLNKKVIDRRVDLMEQEGVEFQCNTDFDLASLERSKAQEDGRHRPSQQYDAYVVATGTPIARDLDILGRDIPGVHLALELLGNQNRVLTGEPSSCDISAKGKKVLVIGGGDTGSDCIGTVRRHGCKSVLQIEIMPKPPVGHNPATPWPSWPVVLKTTSSHEEGCERRWQLNTLRFIAGEDGRLCGAELEEVEWEGLGKMKGTGRKEIVECDLVFLALGFIRPQHPEYAGNVVVAGDAASGASLVVRAIASGREAAKRIDDLLK